MLSSIYKFLGHLAPFHRRIILNMTYLLFIFAFTMPPVLILALLFLPFGAVGMLMAQRQNDAMLYSMPTSDEIVEILKERDEKYHAFVVLSYTVFLPCASCFFIGFTCFIASHLLFMAFFVMAFVWMYWRYFDLYEKLFAK